jgi:hypothetical protein
MHEAGLLAAAVADALADGGLAGGVEGSSPERRPVALEVTVHDPVHVGPESAAMHAELALRARGLGHIPIAVCSDLVECALCGASNAVVAGHPFCAACGMPLPDRGGHAVEARIWWADEVLPARLVVELAAGRAAAVA